MASTHDATERDGYLLQHTPPAGISFAGVGTMDGRLVFLIGEPFPPVPSEEDFDFDLVVEIEVDSPLVTSQRADDGSVELISIDYGRLLACAYNSRTPGCVCLQHEGTLELGAVPARAAHAATPHVRRQEHAHEKGAIAAAFYPRATDKAMIEAGIAGRGLGGYGDLRNAFSQMCSLALPRPFPALACTPARPPAVQVACPLPAGKGARLQPKRCVAAWR